MTLSTPGVKRSVALAVRKARTVDGSTERPDWRTRAAAPAATGDAALVPLKHGPQACVATHDGATMSGFVRPSFVGPCEL